jgi:hypothetical protein
VDALVLCFLPSSATDALKAIESLLALPHVNSGWVFIGDQLASGSGSAAGVLAARFSHRRDAEAFATMAAQRCRDVPASQASVRIEVFQQQPATFADPPLIAFP